MSAHTPYRAVIFDLLSGLLNSWKLWNEIAGSDEIGLRNPHSAFSLRRSPEGDEIVQVEQIENSLYVVPIRRKFLDRTA